MARRPNILYYAAATVAQAAVGVVMVPLLARTLDRAVFGRWMLLEPVLMMAAQCALAGVNYGVMKLIGRDRLQPSTAYRALFGRAFAAATCVGAACGIGAGIWGRSWRLGAFFALAVAAEALFVLAQTTLRGGNLARGFAVSTICKASVVLVVAAGAAFAGWPHLIEPADVAAIYAAGSLCGVAVSSFLLLRGDHTLNALSAPWRSAMHYGLPLLFAGLLSTVVASSDRYALAAFSGVGEVALYVVAVKLANLLNLLANPVNLWFPAARFRHAAAPDGGQRFFPHLALRAAFGYCGIAALMWVAAPWLLTWFAPGFTWNPVTGAGLLGAAVALAMAPPLNVGLLADGRTRWNFVIALVAAGLQVALLLATVPRFGAVGAALCTFTSQAASMVIQHLGSQRTHPLRWPYGRLVGVAAVAATLALTCRWLLGPAIAAQSAAFAIAWLLFGALLWRGARPGTHSSLA
jgi:O-antigen/teichoic acid export membrane protein